jgi:hypothetical protein
MDTPKGWHSYDGGKSLGSRGSEEGVIIQDQEHDAGARISLERDARVAPFAITCGLYGWFFHTCFFSSQAEAETAFGEMKADMERMIELFPDVEAEREGAERRLLDAISKFVERFPT